MTTSGTYAFTVNRDQIIRQSMLNIGKLDPDENPTNSEISDCSLVLNMMVKQWMGKGDFAPGLKVWTRRRGHLFLRSTTGQYAVGPTGTGWTETYVAPTTTVAAAAGAATLTLSSVTGVANGYYIGFELSTGDMQWTKVSGAPAGNVVTLAAVTTASVLSGAQVFCYQTTAQQPIVVETATLRDNQNNDVPLKLLTVQDYDLLPSKTAPTNVSDPSAIYYEYQLGNSNLFTDIAGAQDVTKHIVLTYMEATQDFNAATDTPEYPQEYYLALVWGLSKLIVPMFRAVWTPQMETVYQLSVAIAQKKDPERVTLFYQPGAEE